MALIKNAFADRIVRDAVVLDLGDLSRQGQRIIEQARQEARHIVEQAKAQAQKLIDTAAERGQAEGHERGVQEGRAAGQQAAQQAVLEEFSPQLQALSDRWTAAVEAWERDRAAMLTAAKQDVLAMGLAVGRRVAHRLAKIDPAVVEDQLVEAVSVLTRPSILSVRVHPEDVRLLEQALPQVLQRLQQSHELKLTPDESIQRGGCVLTTGAGHIDATLGTQLDRIVEALLPERDDVKGQASAPPAA